MTRRTQLFGLLLAVVLAVPVFAQRGTTQSPGTSIAPPASLLTGGTHLPPASPSILSRGFGRVDPGPRFNGIHHRPPVVGPLRGTDFRRRDHDRDRDHRQHFVAPLYSGYYYPYYYGYGYGQTYYDDYSDLPGAGTFNSNEQAYAEDDREAPTVFENRRPSGMYYRPNVGANSVIEDRDRYGDHYTDSREGARAEVAEPRQGGVVTANGNENNDTTTVLVFKDGVQREVTNYAIMGQYIFVFSGDRRKIPLSEIDLDATKKVNEDRGNEFKVPSSSKAS